MDNETDREIDREFNRVANQVQGYECSEIDNLTVATPVGMTPAIQYIDGLERKLVELQDQRDAARGWIALMFLGCVLEFVAMLLLWR